VKVLEGGPEATQAALKERFDLIFFTGGNFVGKIVAEAAAKYLCPTILEVCCFSPPPLSVFSDCLQLTIHCRNRWGASRRA
jgi:acyl-CoA reductase-like NAD-dependent aldehyde dehydrogenase